ncbi:hypothetical protein [Paraburkholderia sp. CNPSo 3281]|uniref:hypothetical protein n=1 Tax=Paraburkholderia sp. CNPSo 3281 TaxID=2940933 RepID=UPI0020B8FA16|nr:hypothetical protein [Paraburkholderia sp. CNPSo 3281]MCP3720809.1 hypothetical protein [Paraburkholderia sp. CNPSo 3281]
MNTLQAIAFALALGLSVDEIALAEPVTYTLYAVTDGKIGSQAFSQAKIEIDFKSDTRDVVIDTEAGAIVYRNYRGEATVTLFHDAKKLVAHILPGQIYVRYDTTNGVVGFGSFAVGPTYPISLACNVGVYNLANCLTNNGYGHADQIVAALADTQQQNLYSFTSTLSANLTDPTLLTGYVSACAVAYPANATVCPSPASKAIRTDMGDFYLQDQGYVDKGIFTVRTKINHDEENDDD